MSHEYRILERMLVEGQISRQEFKERIDAEYDKLEQELMNDEIALEKSVLIQYCDMQAEIKELRRLIKMTEERLEKIEKEGAVSDVVSGGMGGIQHFKVTGFPTPEHAKVEQLLVSRRQRLKMKETELLEITNQAEEYIESIEKSELRIMFRLYYIEGLTWAQVAHRMNSLFPKRTKAYNEKNCQKRNERFFQENL